MSVDLKNEAQHVNNTDDFVLNVKDGNRRGV